MNGTERTMFYAAAFSRQLRKLPASAARRGRPGRRGATMEVCSKRQSRLLNYCSWRSKKYKENILSQEQILVQSQVNKQQGKCVCVHARALQQ